MVAEPEESRHVVLQAMAFQMGIAGMLVGFKNTLTMSQRDDYEAAADTMNSLWAR